MAAITHALTGACWGKYPCHDPLGAVGGESETARELARLRDAYDKQTADDRKKIDYLREQVAELQGSMKTRDKLIIGLSLGAGVLAAILIGLLLWGYLA